MNNKSEKDSREQKIKQESDQFIESIAQQYPIEQVRDPNRDPDTLKSGYKELQFVLQSKFEHYQERERSTGSYNTCLTFHRSTENSTVRTPTEFQNLNNRAKKAKKNNKVSLIV